MGELMRDKVLAALALNAEGNESIREVDMNGFAAGDWVNYTRPIQAVSFKSICGRPPVPPQMPPSPW